MFHQALCTLDSHLRHPLMMIRQFVKGGINNLYIVSADCFLDIRHLFRALINKQYQHMHMRIRPQNGFCNLFQ